MDNLYYCDILIFYITVILYMFAGGYKVMLLVLLMMSLFCAIVTALL